MKALVFYQHTRKLSGSTFNMFEYFITILESNPQFKLILLNATQSDVDYYCEIFENRYELGDINYRESIIPMEYKEVIKLNTTLEKVLVLDYGTVNKLRDTLLLPEIIQIAERTEDDAYCFSPSAKNVTIYGEMPFSKWDKYYRMKLAFNRFKKLNKVEQAIYIYSPNNEDKTFIEDLILPKDKKIIFKAESHLSNLFEQFDEYIYYHGNKVIDQHPRLFLECAFYDKKITYINNFGVKDGSYYRYSDLLANGLEHRTLDENDEVVVLFLENQ